MCAQLCLLQIVKEDFGIFGDGTEDSHQNVDILHASLRQLPHLECLTVDPYVDSRDPAPEPLLLPAGPWQQTVRQLAAGADMLAASWPDLGGTVALENLTINTARKRQRAAAQLLRRWAEQPALPLRRLTLKLFNPQAPLKALTNACVAVKGRHSHLDIKLVPHKA